MPVLMKPLNLNWMTALGCPLLTRPPATAVPGRVWMGMTALRPRYTRCWGRVRRMSGGVPCGPTPLHLFICQDIAWPRCRRPPCGAPSMRGSLDTHEPFGVRRHKQAYGTTIVRRRSSRFDRTLPLVLSPLPPYRPRRLRMASIGGFLAFVRVSVFDQSPHRACVTGPPCLIRLSACVP